MRRLLYLGFAYLCVGLGLIGVFLPILPTTPFLLLAIWSGAKGSARFKWWLLRHPKLGPGLRLWYRQGAIPRRARWVAVSFMALSWLLIYAKGSSPFVLILTAVILCCAATFVATRPEPRP